MIKEKDWEYKAQVSYYSFGWRQTPVYKYIFIHLQWIYNFDYSVCKLLLILMLMSNYLSFTFIYKSEKICLTTADRKNIFVSELHQLYYKVVCMFALRVWGMRWVCVCSDEKVQVVIRVFGFFFNADGEEEMFNSSIWILNISSPVTEWLGYKSLTMPVILLSLQSIALSQPPFDKVPGETFFKCF